jgi:hypothetical protein
MWKNSVNNVERYLRPSLTVDIEVTSQTSSSAAGDSAPTLDACSGIFHGFESCDLFLKRKKGFTR